MEDIVWFEKESAKGGARKNEDITIRKTKQGIIITARNGIASDISKTTYIRFGTPKNNQNTLYFMAADPYKGWKLSAKDNKTPDISRAHISDPRMVDLLSRFVGDYDLEISDDNLFYIDRRNCHD